MLARIVRSCTAGPDFSIALAALAIRRGASRHHCDEGTALPGRGLLSGWRTGSDRCIIAL
jgi:hypothetical protein